MAFKDRHLEKFVGAFVVLGMGFFLLVLIYAMSGAGWFTQWNTYNVVLEHGTGLSAGTDVTLAGMEVGQVKSVELTGERTVRVVLQVERKYSEFVRNDSVGQVSMTLGGKVLQIHGGSADAGKLSNGGTLVSGRHFDALLALEKMDLVGNLETLEAILKDINKVANQLELGDGQLPETVDNLNHLIADMQAGRGMVGRALKDDEMADRVMAAVRDVDQMAKQLEQTATKMDTTTTNLDNAAGSVGEGMGHIDRAADSLGKTANDVSVVAGKLTESTERLNVSLIELNRTLKAIQKVPFVRGQMRKEGEEAAP